MSFKFRVGEVTVREYAQYASAVREARLWPQAEFLADLVVGWPYNDPPSRDAIGELRMSQYREIANALAEAINVDSTDEKSLGGFKFNLDNVRFRHYADYLDNVREGKLLEQHEFFERLVVEWPFAGNPTDIEAYKSLSIPQYRLLIQVSSMAIAESTQQDDGATKN